MPSVREGGTMYVAELAFVNEDGYCESFWSMPYFTSKGLQKWIRRNIDERQQKPYRARVAELQCNSVETIYNQRGRPRKLAERPKAKPVKREKPPQIHLMAS